MKKKSKREKQKEESINKIIETTRKMIIKGGYTATTTNHIAKEANVSIGLVYKYFPKGKVDILRMIVKRNLASVYNEEEIINFTKENFPDVLRKILANFVQQHRKNTQLLLAIEIELLTHHQDVYSDFISVYNNESIPFKNIMIRLNELGYFNSKEEAMKTGEFLLKIIDSSVHRHVLYEEFFPSDDEFIENLLKMVLKTVY